MSLVRFNPAMDLPRLPRTESGNCISQVGLAQEPEAALYHYLHDLFFRQANMLRRAEGELLLVALDNNHSAVRFQHTVYLRTHRATGCRAGTSGWTSIVGIRMDDEWNPGWVILMISRSALYVKEHT